MILNYKKEVYDLISIADNFNYKGQKPLDARIKYNTVADMKAVSESDLYDGCLAYVTATKKNYQYDSTNSVDPTTGKWRELQTGGGGGVSYVAGDGIIINDGEISTDNATSEDIEEILTPLPSVKSHGSWVELTGTLTAGQTSITFTSESILADSFIDVYTDADIDYVTRTATVGSLVLTYDVQQSDVTVKVRLS